MKKISLNFLFILFFFLTSISAHSESFDEWKSNFSKYAISQGVSSETLSLVVKDLKFLPKVIQYDRFQPEFYEDTATYIGKRANNSLYGSYFSTYLFCSNRHLLF